MEQDQQHPTARGGRVARTIGRVIVAGLLVAVGGTLTASASGNGSDGSEAPPREERVTESHPHHGGDGRVHGVIAGVTPEFSQCMRSNGIESFPDPDDQGTVRFDGEPGGDLDIGTQEHRAAHEACKDELPHHPDRDPTFHFHEKGSQDGPIHYRGGGDEASA